MTGGHLFRAARRIQDVQTPIIPVVGDWIRQNPGVISLGQGVVHYPPPAAVYDRLASRFADPGMHTYGAVVGIPALRDQIRSKLVSENGILADGTECDVIVTAGANMGFLNAVLATTNPGDEIILLSPFYFNHEMAVGIAGCKATVVGTDSLYQPTLEHICEAITSKTRAVVTISPNNPTGAVYSRDALLAINHLCAERGIFHIHDEAYEYFIYEGADHASPGAFPSAAPHTISLFSLSKAYGFASWRVGYMVVPNSLVEAVRKIQDTNLICPPLPSQEAAVAALEIGRSYCVPHVSRLEGVRKMVLSALKNLGDRVDVPEPRGAFYVLARIHSLMDDLVVTRLLIERFGVAVIPGSAFGLTEGCYLRIAYGALERKSVEEAMTRLVTGLDKIMEDGV
jgi:aspartate/methionine/tyrosine aminotransferase